MRCAGIRAAPSLSEDAVAQTTSATNKRAKVALSFDLFSHDWEGGGMACLGGGRVREDDRGANALSNLVTLRDGFAAGKEGEGAFAGAVHDLLVLGNGL